MRNIWLISHHSSPPEYAVRMRTNLMAKYLSKLGYNVNIFCASTIHNTDINLIENNKVLYIEKEYDGVIYNIIRTSSYHGNGLSRVINLLQFPLNLYRVACKKKEKPDVIICNLTSIFAVPPYLISKKFNSKFIEEVRDLWPESIVAYKGISKKNPIIQIMYKIEKWIYKKADKIIFTMEGGKDYIIDKGWDKDIDMSKIHHINNGVDLEQFNYNKKYFTTKDDDLDDKSTFKVIYAGSVRQANNVRKIVDTAEIIHKKGYKDIKFLIFGDGPDRIPLENYCNENYIKNIIFKGHVKKNKIPYIISRCDLNIIHFEQNSLKKYGASLNKMFEYFASGKPTVSDCKFGYDIILKYKCGIVYDNASPEQLAQAVIKFYNMPKEEYNIYCKNALRAAQDFDFKILTDKLEKVLLED